MVSNKIEYIIMLVQLFAKRYGMPFIEAYRYISSCEGIEYTEHHYNILHTLSFDDQIDGLAHYCHQKEGNLTENEQSTEHNFWEALKQPRSAAELREFLHQTNATRFKENCLEPLLTVGLIAMTQPDASRSTKQKYYLTTAAKNIAEA